MKMEFLPLHYSPESLWMQGMNKLSQYKGSPELEKLAKGASRVMALALPAVASVGVIYHLAGCLGKAAIAMAPKETLEKYGLTELAQKITLKEIGMQLLALKATAFAATVLAVVGVFSPEKALSMASWSGLYTTDMTQINLNEEAQDYVEIFKKLGSEITKMRSDLPETVSSLIEQSQQVLKSKDTEEKRQRLSKIETQAKAEVAWQQVLLKSHQANRYDPLSVYRAPPIPTTPPPTLEEMTLWAKEAGFS